MRSECRSLRALNGEVLRSIYNSTRVSLERAVSWQDVCGYDEVIPVSGDSLLRRNRRSSIGLNGRSLDS
jgi:hypothetical protein